MSINSTCEQCGDDSDLMVAFTKYKVCMKCTKANYRKAVGRS